MMMGELRDLILPVKGEYFDQILRGEKGFEYRRRGAYWDKRLLRGEYRNVVLTRGYPKGGGIEGETRLTRKWNYWHAMVITHPHFGPDPVGVFAIDVTVMP